jgi:carbonic anhydrase
MRTLSELFENNRAWSARIRRNDPAFFPALAAQQSPHYLWIGCADSRCSRQRNRRAAAR